VGRPLILSKNAKLVVCKHGSKGSVVFTKAGEKVEMGIFLVDKLKL